MNPTRTINLALKKKHLSEGIERGGKILSIVSICALCLFLILYVVSFAVLSVYSLKYKENEQKISELTSSINQKKDVEALLLASTNKLSAIESILNSQLPYTSYVQDLFSLPIPGVIFNAFALSPKGTVSIDMVASDSATLTRFVQLLKEKEVDEQKYKAIQQGGITWSPKDGRYSLVVNLAMVKDKFNE